MKKNRSDSQTAYQYNAHSSVSDTKVNDHGWSDAINKMIDLRYAFLALQYDNEGYLFRGMSTGLFDALINNQFWHYAGDDRGNHFEKELDILLFSQDLSDAFTVSKIWEQKQDACILVFKSSIFNDALNEKKAAMMATAEPGVVFKYPFLSYPLTLEDIGYLIVPVDLIDKLKNRIKPDGMDDDAFDKLLSIVDALQVSDKLILCDCEKEKFDRSQVEKIIVESLVNRKISSATTVKNTVKPTRKG